MRPMVLNGDARVRIARVMEYAEANVVKLADIREVIEGKRAPAGDIPEHVCVIPVGFRAVFSMEEQAVGLCRHLSVSIDGPADKVPNPEAVRALMEEFGFEGTLEDACVWSEPFGEGVAINVMEQVK